MFSLFQIINHFQILHGRRYAVSGPDPGTICLFVTDRCTLTCSWCLRQTDPESTRNRPDMTRDTASRIIRMFPRATHVSLAGFGEPLLVDAIDEIARDITRSGRRATMITNGTLLHVRADQLLKAGLHRLSISLNAVERDHYRTVCGGGESGYDDVLTGIRYLVSHRQGRRPIVHISFVLTRDLLDKAEEVVRLAEDLGVDHLDFHNLIAHGDDSDSSLVLFDDDEDVIQTLAALSERSGRVQVSVPRLVRRDLLSPARCCNGLWNWIGVDMEGNVAGCSKAMPADPQYGNAFREGRGSWNNEFRVSLRQSFLDGTFKLACCRMCTEVQP